MKKLTIFALMFSFFVVPTFSWSLCNIGFRFITTETPPDWNNFYPGDKFNLYLNLDCHRGKFNNTLKIWLEINSMRFNWPNWTQNEFVKNLDVAPSDVVGNYWVIIPEFIWPSNIGSGSGTFHAELRYPDNPESKTDSYDIAWNENKPI